MKNADRVYFKVRCEVVATSSSGVTEDLGEEMFNVEFPVRSIGDLTPEQCAVTNISESQTLLGDLAKQCALSASWKAAAALNDTIMEQQEKKKREE